MLILDPFQQGVNRRTVVEADNGKQCYLLDVIAQILFFLKKMVEESLEAYECSDVDWVITVPAIWRAGGKQMMREAAYKVHSFILIRDLPFVTLYMKRGIPRKS